MSKASPIDVLNRNPMMAHLNAALDKGKDIGHYGRLIYAMIARHFLKPEDVAERLAGSKGFDEAQARALVMQVTARDYSPPGPGKIAQWQQEQEFPILPPDHPTSNDANVYQDLTFPSHVYEKINEYYEEKADATMG